MKKYSFIVIASALALVPTSAFAQCFGGRCVSSARVYYGARASYVSYGYATRACSPCGNVVATPAPCAPCEAVETVETPEPCEPVRACDPVATCETCEPGEVLPVKIDGEIVLQKCVNGACPIRQGVATVAKSAKNVVASLLGSVNATRARYGLAALQLDATLEAGAKYQAGVCSASGTLQHGAGVAEILAQNSQGLETAIQQWLNSPAHRALLLNGGYRYAGVGVVRDASGRAWCAVRFR